MKPDLTLSEQKERETIASRVYAATVVWAAAAEERDKALEAADAAMMERAGALHELNEGSCTLDAYEAAVLASKLADRVAHDARVAATAAWLEREQAMKAEKDFRARMDARPEVMCEGCGAPATVLWDGEGFCGDCNAMLETEARMREDEQQADYARTRGV